MLHFNRLWTEYENNDKIEIKEVKITEQLFGDCFFTFVIVLYSKRIIAVIVD